MKKPQLINKENDDFVIIQGETVLADSDLIESLDTILQNPKAHLDKLMDLVEEDDELTNNLLNFLREAVDFGQRH